MVYVATLLAIILLLALGVYVLKNLPGGNAPGREPEDNGNNSDSGVVYEVSDVCFKLKQSLPSGQPSADYDTYVLEDPNQLKLYKITNLTVRGLPPGDTVRLTYDHSKHSQGSVRKIVSQIDLANGQSSSEFNGAVANLPQISNRGDVIRWEGVVKTSGTLDKLPRSIEVCMDMRHES